MDWLNLLSVQGTLNGRLQHHSSKASILWHSAFFIVQLSHPYMTTGKTKALTRWIFVGTVMSLLFNMLSRLVITFLTRSKRLLISWLHSQSAMILESKITKCGTVSIVSPSICHEVMRRMPWSSFSWMLCYARCPNPPTGKDKTSMTMQHAKEGKFIAVSSQGPCSVVPSFHAFL